MVGNITGGLPTPRTDQFSYMFDSDGEWSVLFSDYQISFNFFHFFSIIDCFQLSNYPLDYAFKTGLTLSLTLFVNYTVYINQKS